MGLHDSISRQREGKHLPDAHGRSVSAECIADASCVLVPVCYAFAITTVVPDIWRRERLERGSGMSAF